MTRRNKVSSVYFLLYKLSALELWRNKLGLILFFVIPLVFLAVVEWTTGKGAIPIKLYFFKNTESVLIDQHSISIIFMSAAVSGFLTSYYAVLLFHQEFEYFRYCISIGLSPRTFIASRFSLFFSFVVALAVYIILIDRIIMPLNEILLAILGFILLGICYGAYGGIIGILSKDFMVAILFIVLLANIDAGWLQNPVFYSYAQETEVIHWMPAFFPCQFIFSAIFLKKLNLWAGTMSILYALLLLIFLFLSVRLKIRGLYYGSNIKKD